MLVVGVFLLAIVAGGTASVVGFGIGSLLTPVLAASLGTDVAIAAVMLPHALATALRCWRLRAHVDRDVALRFGALSAVGALAGALAYSQLGPTVMTRVLGGLLILTAIAQLTGWTRRRPHGIAVPLFGLASGFFGGLAGNQGGMRSAALTAFQLSPAAFVATGTAVGVVVDAVRGPVYLWRTGGALWPLWPLLLSASAGVLVGTVVGERIMLGLSPQAFGRILGAAVGVLGVWLLTFA